MVFNYRNMNKNFAEEICYQWKYPGIYSFYDMTEDPDDLREFLDPENWSRYFAVTTGDDLFGFFLYKIAEGAVFIGLGLKPELAGKGYGGEFLISCLEHMRDISACRDKPVRLCVAQFNKRAISLYRKIGFVPYLAY